MSEPVALTDERHLHYAGWVLGTMHRHGLDGTPVIVDGRPSDHIEISSISIYDGRVRFTIVVPPPPDDWPPRELVEEYAPLQ